MHLFPISSSSRSHCLSAGRAQHAIDTAIGPRRYARMFPDVAPFTADETFLRALGRAGGVCDCGTAADEAGSEGGVAAGWPIFGQFIAHDITADRSALQSHAEVNLLRNYRQPLLNLEGLYGDGPVGHPFLFRRDDPAKFLFADGDADLPRNTEGIALIGDPRDDSHMLVSQFHLAMLQVHNAFVDDLRATGADGSTLFDHAAAWMRWCYQWIVVHEFLPGLVGRPLVDELLRDGPRYFRPAGEPFIPLEFADAAYRYGHCQIRHQYRVNHHSDPVALFPDLLGFRPVPPERRVDWSLFFDGPNGTPAQRAKKIDGKLVPSLIQLPVAVTGECQIDEYHSLAVRDLERGQGVGLPSGESLARHLGIDPLTPDQVGLATTGWQEETPLWYYVLREADVREGGHRLGPLGGRIVAEVIIGLLLADPSSILNTKEKRHLPVDVEEGPAGTSLWRLLAWAGAGLTAATR